MKKVVTKHKHTYKVFVLCVSTFVGTQLHADSQTQQPTPQEEQPLVAHEDIEVIDDVSDKTDQYNKALKAAYQHSTGRLQQSLTTYLELLKKNPSQHAYNGFLNILFDTEQWKKIIKIYESKSATFDKIFGKNVEIQLMLAQAYLNTNQDAKAESILTRLAEQYPDNAQVMYATTLAYLKSSQLAKALETIEKNLNNKALKQRHFLFYFLKSKVLVQQNKFKDALAAIEKSLELFPKFDSGLLLKAALLEQLGRVDDAIAGYKNFLDIFGHDISIEKQLINLLNRQQRTTEVAQYTKELQTKSPEYFYDQAMKECSAQSYKKALVFIDKSLNIAPNYKPAQFGKIEILLHLHQIPQLLSFMQTWITQDPSNIEAVHTLLVLRKTMVPVEQIIQTLRNLEQKQPHVNILASIADLLVESNKHDQALEYYNKIAATTQDQALKSKVLFQIGYVHFINNQPAKLEKSLHLAIKCKPVYPSVYNLLAYHYAQTNMHLEYSFKLINKALEQAPECHYYRDTQGFILYKMGKRTEAINAFKQALELAPDDMVIKKHLKAALGNQEL